MADVLGKRLVKCLVETGSLDKLQTVGITENDFYDEAKKAYLWALDYKGTYGTFPTCKQIEENLKIEIPATSDLIDYVCDLVVNRRLAKGIDKGLRAAAHLLDSRDPKSALEELENTIQTVKSLVPVTKDTERSFRKEGPTRYDEYVQLKRGVNKNLPTPWRKLDLLIGGWVPGTLNVFIAMMNVGKSWSSCIIALDSFKKGEKVLFVTMEMSKGRIERRLDSLYYKIPFADLVTKEIDIFREARWKQELINEVNGRGDIIVSDKKEVKYVSDVQYLVEKHSPSLVVIDGGYRFVSKRKRDSWESAKDVVDELQLVAEFTNVPWIVTTQQGELSGKSNMESSHRGYKVKYAKEWIINPDNVVELIQDDDYRLQKVMGLRMLKIRDDPSVISRDEFQINWNMEAMDFTEVSDEDQKLVSF
jgi:hypothetical protein